MCDWARSTLRDTEPRRCHRQPLRHLSPQSGCHKFVGLFLTKGYSQSAIRPDLLTKSRGGRHIRAQQDVLLPVLSLGLDARLPAHARGQGHAPSLAGSSREHRFPGTIRTIGLRLLVFSTGIQVDDLMQRFRPLTCLFPFLPVK